MRLMPSDPRLCWQGSVSVEHTSSFCRVWRLPYWDIELFPGKMLQERAEMPAGVRLSFVSDATYIGGTVVSHGGNISPIDLCCDGEYIGTCELNKRDCFAFERLPSGKKPIELWLPQFGRFELCSLELSDDAIVEKYRDKRPVWVTYGSSLTQCAGAPSPLKTWPAIVSRKADLNLTCLGFNGECQMDSMIGRVIRDIPADFVSICAGVNVYGKSSLNDRTFRAALLGFIKIIREKHPQIPIGVISPIFAVSRETKINNAGLNYESMRGIIIDCVNKLKQCGDPDIFHVNGLDLVNENNAELLSTDGLHLKPEGNYHLAENFFSHVWEPVASRVVHRETSQFLRTE